MDWSILAKPCESKSAGYAAARTTLAGHLEVGPAHSVQLDDQVDAPQFGVLESPAEGELDGLVELELGLQGPAGGTLELLCRIENAGLRYTCRCASGFRILVDGLPTLPSRYFLYEAIEIRLATGSTTVKTLRCLGDLSRAEGICSFGLALAVGRAVQVESA